MDTGVDSDIDREKKREKYTDIQIEERQRQGQIGIAIKRNSDTREIEDIGQSPIHKSNSIQFRSSVRI